MTYAERSHLYILRRAVRKNLRCCHRHSSPTYLPTALLLSLHPPIAHLPDRAHSCFLLLVSLSLSLFLSLSLSLLLFRSFYRFARFSHFFLCIFLSSCYFENIKSRLPFFARRISTFFYQRRFFQSLFDHSNVCLFILDSFYMFIFRTFALFNIKLVSINDIN